MGGGLEGGGGGAEGVGPALTGGRWGLTDRAASPVTQDPHAWVGLSSRAHFPSIGCFSSPEITSPTRSCPISSLGGGGLRLPGLAYPAGPRGRDRKAPLPGCLLESPS